MTICRRSKNRPIRQFLIRMLPLKALALLFRAQGRRPHFRVIAFLFPVLCLVDSRRLLQDLVQMMKD